MQPVLEESKPLSKETSLESTSIIPAVTDPGQDFVLIAKAVWQERKSVLTVTLVSTILALTLGFVMPKSYLAASSILPRDEEGSVNSLAMGVASQLGGAGLLAGLTGGRTDDLVEILSSRSMADRVIASCKLDQKIKGWKYHSELVKQVQRMTKITPPTVKNKVIGIQVEAPDAGLAADMANAYVDELKGMLDEIGYNRAAHNRKFVESQLNAAKKSLGEAEDKLARYQSVNRIAALPETVMASIKAISDLEAQRIAASVQERSTEEAISSARGKIDSLQVDPNELTGLEIKQKSLAAEQKALVSAKENFMANLAALPPKAISMARLERDVQVQNAIYLALTQLYQSAVINESKESDSFLSLDRAVAPDFANRPKKLLMLIIGLIGGWLLGVFYILSKPYIRSLFRQFRA